MAKMAVVVAWVCAWACLAGAAGAPAAEGAAWRVTNAARDTAQRLFIDFGPLISPVGATEVQLEVPWPSLGFGGLGAAADGGLQVVVMVDGTHTCNLHARPQAPSATARVPRFEADCAWVRPRAERGSPALHLAVDAPSRGLHLLALYARTPTANGAAPMSFRMRLVGGQAQAVNVTGLPTEGQRAAFGTADNRTFRAGVYVTPYLVKSAQAAEAESARLGRPAPTIEDVLRSNGTVPLASVPAGVTGLSNQYLHLPALGYYCTYRKREGEVGIRPDCANITRTVRWQAAWMTAAGLDYMLFDHTNFNHWYGPGGADCRDVPPPAAAERAPANTATADNTASTATPDTHGRDKGRVSAPARLGSNHNGNTCDADLYQMRPAEVQAEEFAALRSQGYATPALGTFTGLRAGENLWSELLDRYFNRYPELMLQHAGKMVFGFGMSQTGSTNWTAVAEVEGNRGAFNVSVVPIDFVGNMSSWEYLTACTVDGADTTIILPERRCHSPKYNSSIGTSRTIMAEAALNSFPLGSPGRLYGLTLQKLFEDALADPSDWIFLPSWNEFVCGNRSMSAFALPENNTYFQTDGLEFDPGDRHLLYIDGWGLGKSRSLEPSVHDRGATYELLASCLRVLRLARTPGHASTTCNVEGEPCCQRLPRQNFARFWSLEAKDGSDALVATDPAEVRRLLAGGLYREMCNPFSTGARPSPAASADFCVNTSLPYRPFPSQARGNYDVRRGPFVAWDNSTAIPGVTSLLYRCVDARGRHFVAVSAACDAKGTLEATLGAIQDSRDGLAQRSLHRCQAPAGLWYTALDGACFHTDRDDGILGFVL